MATEALENQIKSIQANIDFLQTEMTDEGVLAHQKKWGLSETPEATRQNLFHVMDSLNHNLSILLFAAGRESECPIKDYLDVPISRHPLSRMDRSLLPAGPVYFGTSPEGGFLFSMTVASPANNGYLQLYYDASLLFGTSLQAVGLKVAKDPREDFAPEEPIFRFPDPPTGSTAQHFYDTVSTSLEALTKASILNRRDLVLESNTLPEKIAEVTGASLLN